MGKAVLKGGAYHTCPLSDGTKPHVGGPTLGGASSVFFEDLPVCRIGDALQCNSPSIDHILTGSTSFFIEDQGAAIEGLSQTVHGGVVTKGGAMTVLIED